MTRVEAKATVAAHMASILGDLMPESREDDRTRFAAHLVHAIIDQYETALHAPSPEPMTTPEREA